MPYLLIVKRYGLFSSSLVQLHYIYSHTKWSAFVSFALRIVIRNCIIFPLLIMHKLSVFKRFRLLNNKYTHADARDNSSGRNHVSTGTHILGIFQSFSRYPSNCDIFVSTIVIIIIYFCIFLDVGHWTGAAAVAVSSFVTGRPEKPSEYGFEPCTKYVYVHSRPRRPRMYIPWRALLDAPGTWLSRDTTMYPRNLITSTFKHWRRETLRCHWCARKNTNVKLRCVQYRFWRIFSTCRTRVFVSNSRGRYMLSFFFFFFRSRDDIGRRASRVWSLDQRRYVYNTNSRTVDR